MDAAVTTLKFESKSVIPTDPRTKLFLTVTVSTIMITGGTGGFMNLVRPCLMACPIVFLLLSRKWVDAVRFAVTYAILFAFEVMAPYCFTKTSYFTLRSLCLSESSSSLQPSIWISISSLVICLISSRLRIRSSAVCDTSFLTISEFSL